jgi:hypothetical protein
MGDAAALARAFFTGCGANVGPLIGIELGVGEPVLETSEQPPDGVLAVLPVDADLGGGAQAGLELVCPLADLARLARRMLGNDDPDAKRELSDDDREAIGEILGVMGGSLDQALREQVRAARARTRAWWRSDQPGEAGFAPGPRAVARVPLAVPGGDPIELALRFPPDLLERGSAAAQKRRSILLLDLEPELAEPLARALASAGLEVCSAEPSEPAGWSEIGAAIVSGESGRGFSLARRLRTAAASWRVPVVLCLRAPTRALVLRALECGASHVLAVPAGDGELLRVLELARGR